MMCIRVDLPDPEGPMMATNSPSSTVRSNPFQDRDRQGARPVTFLHLLQPDHRVFTSAPLLRSSGGSRTTDFTGLHPRQDFQPISGADAHFHFPADRLPLSTANT